MLDHPLSRVMTAVGWVRHRGKLKVPAAPGAGAAAKTAPQSARQVMRFDIE
jgi:hypothetical protein